MAFWDLPETGDLSLATSWPLSQIPLPLPVSLAHLSFLFIIFVNCEVNFYLLILITCRLEDGDVGYEEPREIDGEGTESAA